MLFILGVSKYKQAFSTGVDYELAVREHTCCCKACLLGEYKDCDIKVLFNWWQNVIISRLILQDYIDIPKIVHFKPKLITTRNLSDEVLPEDFSVDLDKASEDNEESDQEIKNDPKPGKLYIILGDCVEGYYIVKCLSSNGDSMTGRYLTQVPGTVFDTICAFQETRNSKSDIFRLESIFSEVFAVNEVVFQKKSRFSIEKEELDDILASIGELSDIWVYM